jgi:hypothetical protein
MMRLRPCLVHGFDGASFGKALSSQERGPFLFVSCHVHQHWTAFARGAFAADGIAAQGSDEHVPVMAAAFSRDLSILDTSAPSCLLMCVNGSMLQPDAGQLVSLGQPNQCG